MLKSNHKISLRGSWQLPEIIHLQNYIPSEVFFSHRPTHHSLSFIHFSCFSKSSKIKVFQKCFLTDRKRNTDLYTTFHIRKKNVWEKRGVAGCNAFLEKQEKKVNGKNKTIKQTLYFLHSHLTIYFKQGDSEKKRKEN